MNSLCMEIYIVLMFVIYKKLKYPYNKYYYLFTKLNNMLDSTYVVFHDIFPNFNDFPCKHFNKILLQLSFTCKLFNEIYGKVREEFECDICMFREISCKKCIKNKTTSCVKCRCKKCGTSKNFIRHKWFYEGYCNKCSGKTFSWVKEVGTNIIESLQTGDMTYSSEYLRMWEELNGYNRYRGL